MSKRLTIYLDDDSFQKLEDLAEVRNRSVSDTARLAIKFLHYAGEFYE